MSALGRANAGRPRKPTAAKKLAGTFRADRSNPLEPSDAPVRIPEAPPSLSDRERRIWGEWARVLDPRLVVTAADMRAFGRLVKIDALIEQAHEQLPADGSLVVEVATKSGVSLQEHPALRIIAKFEKLLVYYFTRFGLTPADRSRVSSLPAPADKEDELSEFDA